MGQKIQAPDVLRALRGLVPEALEGSGFTGIRFIGEHPEDFATQVQLSLRPLQIGVALTE